MLKILGQLQVLTQLDFEIGAHHSPQLNVFTEDDNKIPTGLKSISSVNMRIYRLCRPLIWKVSIK